MTAPLLELRALSGGYDPIQIFQGVDLVLDHNTSVGFFGPNGHGKSTLMKTISGVQEPWSGDVIFEGQRMNREAHRGSRRFRNFNYDAVTRRRMDPKAVARAGLIHVPQGNLLFPEMTVEEVLSIAPIAATGRVGASKEHVGDIASLFPRLADRRHHKIRYLSGGSVRWFPSPQVCWRSRNCSSSMSRRLACHRNCAKNSARRSNSSKPSACP